MQLPQGVTSAGTRVEAQNAAEGTKSPGEYWWLTSGQDLGKMLQEAEYPERAQEKFLEFYKDVVCPQLGPGPGPDSLQSSISWDGNPFEYSFDLKGSTSKPRVRIAADISQLRPPSKSSPLSPTTTQNVIDWLGKNLAGFDDTWVKSLSKFFDCSHLPAEEQQTLIGKVGHQTPTMLGFDIHDHVSALGGLSGLAKIYFHPCFLALAKKISRWEAVYQAIQQIPGIQSQDNVLRSLAVIQDYLSEKPQEWQDGARFLATDFAVPEKARIKIYMRCLERDFDAIWDYYTLGGRIPGMDCDKDAIRDFINLICGGSSDQEAADGLRCEENEPDHTSVRCKASYIYFSLSADRSTPAPKIGIYPSSMVGSDRVIARGLDIWLRKYGWYDGGKSMEEKLSSVFTHRKLEAKTGIFTFVGIGRKEDGPNLSIQTYLTPELYHTPRLFGRSEEKK